MKPVRVFFSYAHEDENFRIELEKHLSFLKRSKKIIGWHDRRISAGGNWEQEINENIDQAQVILMLISPDFINSDYCYETESIRALERHKKKEARVIPVIIRPCLWAETPFKNIQALPKDGKPVTSFSNPDEAWLNVAEGLLKVIDQMLEINREIGEGNDNVIPESSESVNLTASNPKDQILFFLEQYKQYWFIPSKIKNMADKVEGTRDLTNLDVQTILIYCEELAKKGKLNASLNAKGNKIFKYK